MEDRNIIILESVLDIIKMNMRGEVISQDLVDRVKRRFDELVNA